MVIHFTIELIKPKIATITPYTKKNSFIKAVDPKIPFKAVHVSRGEAIRAARISALYEQGKVHHFGTFPQLEDQMCEWIPGVEKSPDRTDALGWAITKLSERFFLWRLRSFEINQDDAKN